MIKQTEQEQPRVLVIEDQSLVALELEDILTDLGYHVLGVGGSLDAALELVIQFGDELDAVLLDANLSGQSAAPVADLLRWQDVPFVLSSGYEADELRYLGFDAPRLAKPYVKEDVRRALLSLSLEGRPN